MDKKGEKMENDIEKLKKDIDKIRLKIDAQQKIIDSQYELLNLLFEDNNIKAHGTLRKIQLHTLELLKFILKICEKYNLQYWLDYGTLIGAIRHGGFVPWDDEIDIAMPRKDYEIFLKVIRKELKRFPELKKKIILRLGVGIFRNIKINGSRPSPSCQFINKVPLANVDVHPIDYYNIETSIKKNVNVKYRREFLKTCKSLIQKVNDGTYTSFEEGTVIEGEKVGIVHKKTDYLGSSIDGTGRKPVHINEIYPLKTISFENIEVYCPNNSLLYLSAFYSDNTMKIPKVIRHHNRITAIQKQLNNENINEVLDESIIFWKYINSKF